MRLLRCLVLSSAALVSACVGAFDDGPEGPPGAGECDDVRAPVPLQLLTPTQIDNTLRDLLGITTPLARPALPAPGTVEGFSVVTTVSPIVVETLVNIAEQASTGVGAREDLVGCVSSGDAAADAVCAHELITRFGMRAWRRPLTDEEVTDLMAVYTDAEANGRPFAERIDWIVAALLVSPHFLYHQTTQPGETAGATVALESYELASRLSYFLWNTMPDDALFDAAGSGRLTTDADVERETRRMLEDPRAREGVLVFFSEWLRFDRVRGITRDGTTYPTFDAQVTDDLATSLQLFVEDAFWNGDYETLMTSDRFFVNERLASLYGVSGVSGEELVPVAAPEGERLGLLTQPGLMALLSKSDTTDPIHRGLFVRREVMCETFGPPPADAMGRAPAPPGDGTTTRDRFFMHSQGGCSACHARIDPAGFAFEHYDPIGRFRTLDEGLPIDASAEIVGSVDVDGHVEDGLELAQRLADSRSAEACMAQQWVRFAARRPMERDALTNTISGADACLARDVGRAFVASDGDFRELLVAVVRSRSFRTRHVPDDLGAAPTEP